MVGNGDKLKTCAFCQLLYIEFGHFPPTRLYRNNQRRKEKLWFLFLSFPNSPSGASPRHRVTASGASLDNDTFTLTCHQCPSPN
ncbi:MAG: hypothetical protein F6K31_32455 [Symploca sp. SIO2G7]|nr:hypothetical protein [Symploca sp. SIO2G7]